MLSYNTTPVQEIRHPLAEKAGVRLLVKREDLNHSFVSGNKWWKLRYNLEEARRQNKTTVLTFGGAYSNHIYSTAAAARELKLASVGVIRGEEMLPLNATLSFVRSCGMMLHYITREQYRLKNDAAFAETLHDRFGDFYLIPEGGTNTFAVKGCAEFARTHLATLDFDHLFLPVGTGGTMAGIIEGLKGKKSLTGIAVLKGDFLSDDVQQLLSREQTSHASGGNWTIINTYHHGGYAKTSAALTAFIGEMKEQFDLPLDHVYTAKLMWAVLEEIKRGAFSRGATLLALHTGGLQGTNL